MRITFTEDGGATFILFDQQGNEIARETIPWIEVLKTGAGLTQRAEYFLKRGTGNNIQMGNVSVTGRATVTDGPPKETPSDPDKQENP